MTDNDLSPEEKETILHSLGLDRRKRWSCRNYFYGYDDTCDRLVERGYMAKRDSPNRSLFPQAFYHVTDAGIEAVGMDRKVRREDRLETYLPLPAAST